MQFVSDNSVIEAKSTRLPNTKHSGPAGITASGYLNVETVGCPFSKSPKSRRNKLTIFYSNFKSETVTKNACSKRN